MARSQLPAILALLLLAASARQAPAAATPAARQLTQVDNDALQAAALPPAVMEALRNATQGLPPGSTIKVTPSGLTISASAVINPLEPADGSAKVYTLTIPHDGPPCTIADVDVTVQWVKCQGGITDAGDCIGTGPAGSNEISLDVRTQDTASGDPFSLLIAVGDPTSTYGPGPEPGASFTVTFDDHAATQVGGGGDPVSGTFRPAVLPLSGFNGLEARGRSFHLVYSGNGIPTGKPFALQSWSLSVTCAPVDQGEPPCDEGNFIGPGANFWGPKTKPGSDDLVTQADPAIGGWPDVCAKTFDACQAETTDPAVFDTTCGCALWACLNPCFAKECPVTGEGPICPPQGLRAYYCNKLKDAGATTCGDDAPALPDDCDSLAPAAATVAKRARRNRA